MSIYSSEPVLEKIVTHVSSDLILDMYKSGQFENVDVNYLYKIALKHKLSPLTEVFFQNPGIQEKYKFLEGREKEWIEKQEFEKLDYPEFGSHGKDFKDVVKSLTENQYNRHILREFAKLTLRYGVRCLNNWMILKTIYRSKEIKVSDYLKLDHSKRIKQIPIVSSLYSDAVLARYGVRRCVQLLESPESSFTNLRKIMFRLSMVERGQLLKTLPRKPKNIDAIVEFLEQEIARMLPPEKEVEQDILSWEGREVQGFKVKIPKLVADFMSWSKVMDNCLDSYVGRVVRKERQVFLLEKGDLKLAVGLFPSGKRWFVKDILGVNNDPSYQEKRGKSLRDEIQTWCEALPKPPEHIASMDIIQRLL